jgi:predicted heme/steroid binding protein
MDFFLIHFISSIISAILIIALSAQCFFKKMGYHKWIAITMVVFGIISFISSYLYGFILSIDLTMESLHNLFGFASLILSFLPFIIVYVFKKSSLHYKVSYLASFFAMLSIITGLVAYNGTMLNYFAQEQMECFNINELNFSDRCLVAVDGVVYDMTGMPRWQSGIHYDYSCGGNYSEEYIVSIMPSHAQEKYYGSIAGYLCE